MVRHIAWFDRHDPALEPVLGGKNASLGILTSAGLPVPAGFAVTAEAYRRAFRETGLDDQVDALVGHLDDRDEAKVAWASGEARALVASTPMPAWLSDQIDEAYGELSQRCGLPDLPVAVRSSATSEDQPDASFAGEHDTYLWIRSADQVREHVLRCWASLYTERAMCYRRDMRHVEVGEAMSVGIQQMVLPRAAGVAFTLNPINGDRSQVAIDASWGLGEAVVGGSVTPDNYLVDKVVGEITARIVSDKTVEHLLDGDDRVVERPVEPERRTVACLSDEEILAVAALARRAERHYGRPQDVEWAIDPLRPEGDTVVLLQSRPETVWSRRRTELTEVAKDTFSSIVHNLMHPAGNQTVHLH